MNILENKVEKEVAKFPITDMTVITCMEVCEPLGLIFLGTTKGRLRICCWPLYDGSEHFKSSLEYE